MVVSGKMSAVFSGQLILGFVVTAEVKLGEVVSCWDFILRSVAKAFSLLRG